ncbi:holocytochrome c synthase [Tilletia horrida]|uniref:Holocytochrome c-type synthase n=1 Tax=Tilletia horrida TaxID=155126 RepID=A0AAN6GU28_9BASI|nr:holocytochrome c synthase [Tilletia horrida]
MLLDSWHSVISAAAAHPAAGPSSTRGAAAQLPRDHPPVPAFNSLSPPPGCPMHKGDGASSIPPTRGAMGASGASSSEQSFAKAAAAFSTDSSSSSSGAAPARSWSETLNPLNMMPFLSNSRASEKQKAVLPTERVVSSIPRSASSPGPGASPYDKASAPASASSSAGPAKCPVDHGRVSAGATQQQQKEESEENQYWEYPSPQQFYNALVRKGWETPEEHVEMMVLIHNWLNEAAWQEVLDWERRAGVDPAKVELARFQGKPGTLSPKARVYNLLGQVMPSRFQSEPPFDRHDWIVRRPPPPGSSAAPQEVRYIIDYYSVPESEQANAADEPEFVLDIRPALDSVGSAWVRIQKTWDEYAAAAAAPGSGSTPTSASN